MSLIPMVFYTYLWLRENDGTFPAGVPYYAGKGKGRRAFKSQGHSVYPPKDKSCILIQEFPNEESAFEGEKLLICMYGRIDQGTGCLRNLTDGGDGSSGWVASPQIRAKVSAAKKGKKLGPQSREHRARLAIAHIGKKQSPEAIEKAAASHRGKKNRPLSLETREKLSVLRKGRKLRPWSAEHRIKMSNCHRDMTAVITANKARIWTPQMRMKIGAASRGRKFCYAMLVPSSSN